MKLTCSPMATFDQLAAAQRAIIELVLRQGRGYDEIGEMLDSPPARVRELARDALGELAPFTGEFVGPQWRGPLADYVLGQQTGPEAQATRGHLRRSEPARIWAYSLLDALDDFYADADRPEIPVGEAGAKPRPREREATLNGEGPLAPLAPAPRRSRAAAGRGPPPAPPPPPLRGRPPPRGPRAPPPAPDRLRPRPIVRAPRHTKTKPPPPPPP